MPAKQPSIFQPKYIIAGSLTRDFVITANHVTKLDYAGGPGAFAAAGLALWDKPVGIVGRVGEDYPREWLESFHAHGIDARGVKELEEPLDVRRFYGYDTDGSWQPTGMVGRFAEIEYPLPAVLLNYAHKKPVEDDLRTRGPGSPLSSDFPADYLDAIAAHICPFDFLTQGLLQSTMHTGQIRTITLEADPAYLHPQNWNLVPGVVSGLSAFFVDEEAARLFFRSRSNDLIEIASGFSNMGCETVVICRADGSRLVYQRSSSRKWDIPAYPAQPVNRHSSGHAFGGGFLAGYHLTYDPLLAAVYGCVSASIASEGLHPLDVFAALPGLAETRLDVLQKRVKLL